MKIVVLDGFTMNPGDLSWEGLEELGSCNRYDRTAREGILARASGAEAILTNKVALDKVMLEALPALRYIGITATGTNVVDLGIARARGVTVTNVPAYGAKSIAQAALALLLELTNHVGYYNQSVREGKWQSSPDFCYWDRKIIALSGLTMGVVGLGSIGTEVARLAQAFGMKLLAHTRTQRVADPMLEIEFCELDDLFARSDVISLHCSLTSETLGMVDAGQLSLMKPSALLLNTSRGALIDENALAAALSAGKIAGAAVDVLSVEPPHGDNPLLAVRNCIITPHIAWAAQAARQKLLDITVDNLRQFLKGQPVNVVNA